MTENADDEDPGIWEIKAILRRFESVSEICNSFLEFGFTVQKAAEDSEVFWLERSGNLKDDPWVTFTVSPVSIAPSLKEALFETNKTVVCVSATLSTGGAEQTEASFRFWAERTGAALAERNFLCGVFPSPFPYSERTLLAVPSDAPLPDSPDYQDFTGHAITELVRLTGGSALVLFTSYQALQKAFKTAAPVLEEEGIRCLKQGYDDRMRLLQLFLEDKTSVLFGTDSFWEGIDAPGDTLRLLILCRLPFKTLKDPVFEARREYLENSGRNSFAELSLPDAIMKFKQGFGRLMRNSSDYGAVVVLDGRLLQKYYGKIFLSSLPETKMSIKELDGILIDMERFFY
jgi:ATP-dependent DNA helicase DinG